MTRRAGWGEKHWVVSASMLSSAQSFVVSAGAVKVLDLPEFGLFALCLTSAYFVGAMVRASTAETGLGASLGASLPRSRVMFAYALGFAAGMALVAAQLLWVGESQGVLLPASLSCASVAAAEVSKVRLIERGHGRRLLLAETGRLLAVVGALALFAPGIAGLLLIVAAAPGGTMMAGLLAPDPSGVYAVELRLRLVAAFDVFVQRVAGQLSTVLIFTAASATAAGTIAAARLGFAPLTTLYSSVASLALVGEIANQTRLKKMIIGVVSAGAVYASTVLLATSNSGLGQALLGQNSELVSPAVLPISIFVIGGAAAPLMSTTLRRINKPSLSLRARLLSSAALLLAVAISLFVLDLDEGKSLAWAYAVAGLLSAYAWWATVGRISERNEVMGDAA